MCSEDRPYGRLLIHSQVAIIVKLLIQFSKMSAVSSNLCSMFSSDGVRPNTDFLEYNGTFPGPGILFRLASYSISNFEFWKIFVTADIVFCLFFLILLFMVTNVCVQLSADCCEVCDQIDVKQVNCSNQQLVCFST